MLTLEQLKHFAQHGWLIREKVFDGFLEVTTRRRSLKWRSDRAFGRRDAELLG